MEKSPSPTASGPTSPPDPHKLLAHWMEWERGETPPGRVVSNLKTGGLRDVLEQLVAQADHESSGGADRHAAGATAAGASGSAAAT